MPETSHLAMHVVKPCYGREINRYFAEQVEIELSDPRVTAVSVYN